jgi:hypothetical protein
MPAVKERITEEIIEELEGLPKGKLKEALIPPCITSKINKCAYPELTGIINLQSIEHGFDGRKNI